VAQTWPFLKNLFLLAHGNTNFQKKKIKKTGPLNSKLIVCKYHQPYTNTFCKKLVYRYVEKVKIDANNKELE